MFYYCYIRLLAIFAFFFISLVYMALIDKVINYITDELNIEITEKIKNL